MPTITAEQVMSDAAWEWSHRNGNPIPLAECGQHHRGPCCGCLYCCK